MKNIWARSTRDQWVREILWMSRGFGEQLNEGGVLLEGGKLEKIAGAGDAFGKKLGPLRPCPVPSILDSMWDFMCEFHPKFAKILFILGNLLNQ